MRLPERLVRTALVVLGIVTATPALVLVSPTALDVGYGIGPPPDQMVDALLRHRGVLQAALGAALVWAAFRPADRVPIALTALVTKSSFLLLMGTLPASTRSGALLGVLFDVVAIAALATIALHQRRAGRPDVVRAPS